MANKITTKSYAIKRLKDCGYNVDKLDDIAYTEDDLRKWSILVDNGCASLIVTCLKAGNIQFYDGDRFLNSKLVLNTDSIEVLIEYLNTKGIINKHYSYSNKQA
jgi:hypothetical protein